MSKFGWDLPPGCTHRMIEEAAGCDAQTEALADELYAVTAAAGLDLNTLPKHEAVEEALMRLLGDVYKEGYDQGGHDALLPPAIMSIDEINKMLRTQADMRSLENDEAGVLQDLADQLVKRVAEL